MSEIQSYIKKIESIHGKEISGYLNDLYQFLFELVPNSTECISYGMPCLKLNNKPVVYFAGYKSHIGFYPTTKPIEHFKDQLVCYKTSKGAIQFKINEQLPFSLIDEMIKFNLNRIR